MKRIGIIKKLNKTLPRHALKTIYKSFDTSLFSIVSDPLETANILNEDLDKIRRWDEQWKMAFNPDPTKQSSRSRFFKKTSEIFSSKSLF